MKKNLVKKLLIGGLITTLCFCCCFLNFVKNVNASAINEYQEENRWFEDATFVPNSFSDINELKGKTFNFPSYYLSVLNLVPFSLIIEILERDYIGIEINEITHETIQCIDYLQYPYLIFSSYNSINEMNEFSIFSFYQESSSLYSIFYKNDIALNVSSSFQLNGSLLSYNNNFAYLPLDEINEVDDIPFSYYATSFVDNLMYSTNVFNINFLNEENFLNQIEENHIDLTSFYFVFPNTDRYNLRFSSTTPQQFITIFESFEFIQPYNANIEDRLNYGKEQYTSGYNKGISDATDGEYRFYFLTGIFNAVSDILAIEIFPNVQIGYFILVPLALGITGMIFYFWRKD